MLEATMQAAANVVGCVKPLLRWLAQALAEIRPAFHKTPDRPGDAPVVRRPGHRLGSAPATMFMVSALAMCLMAGCNRGTTTPPLAGQTPPVAAAPVEAPPEPIKPEVPATP